MGLLSTTTSRADPNPMRRRGKPTGITKRGATAGCQRVLCLGQTRRRSLNHHGTLTMKTTRD